jgi:hypothetical protein
MEIIVSVPSPLEVLVETILRRRGVKVMQLLAATKN